MTVESGNHGAVTLYAPFFNSHCEGVILLARWCIVEGDADAFYTDAFREDVQPLSGICKRLLLINLEENMRNTRTYSKGRVRLLKEIVTGPS